MSSTVKSSTHRPNLNIPNHTSHSSSSYDSFPPSQPPPHPASANTNANCIHSTSSTTDASSRELGSKSTSTTSLARSNAPKGKLFRITPGPSQLRVIPPSEVVVVPDSEDELEDTEEDEGGLDLSKVPGERSSDPNSSRTKVGSNSAPSSRTKAPGSVRHSSSPKTRKRSSDATASISSRSRPVTSSRHSRPSSSHHSSGTSSKPIRLDLCETSSSESIVLLQSPPNTFRRPMAGISTSRDGKDGKMEGPSSSQGQKPLVARSSAFGSHAKKVDGKIIPPPHSQSSIQYRDQSHEDPGRVRTVGGNDTTLSLTQKHASEARRSAPFEGQPSKSPARSRSEFDRRLSAAASSSKPTPVSNPAHSSRNADMFAKLATFYRDSRAPSQPVSKSSRNHVLLPANSSESVAPRSSKARLSNASDGSSSSRSPSKHPHGSKAAPPATTTPTSARASPATNTPSSVPKRRTAQPFPMQDPSPGPLRASPSPPFHTPHQKPKIVQSLGSGRTTVSSHGPRTSTVSKPLTPSGSISKYADSPRVHGTARRTSPSRDSLTSKEFLLARGKPASSSSASASTSAKPAPTPTSTSKLAAFPKQTAPHTPNIKHTMLSVSARPATASPAPRSSASPAKRRREPRFDEDEESYRPKQHSQALSESPEVSRPKRARPEPGRYTIPTIDAPQWPTKSGAFGPKATKRPPPGQRPSKAPTSGTRAEASASVRPSSATRSSPLSSAPPTSQSPVTQTRARASTSSLTVLPTSSQSPTKSVKSITPRQSHFDFARSSPLSPPEEEEEEEPVEEAKVEAPMDLLADFEDFQFEPESPKTVRSLPGSQTRIHQTPDQSSLEDVFYTPKSRPSTSTPRTPSRRPIDKSPMSVSRTLLSPRQPQPIIISPKYVKIALGGPPAGVKAKIPLDAILAAAERKAAEEKELLQKQREQRQRQMAEYTARIDAEEEEEEEEKIEDLGAFLDIAKEERRQSVRLRSASVSTDTDAKPKPALGKRRVPSDFDLLMKEHKRNERRGISGPQTEAILAAIGESVDGEEEVPYPTPPISGDGEEEDETPDDIPRRPGTSRQISGLSIRAALDNVPQGVIDDEFVRGMAEGEDREESEEVEQRRPAFWTGPQVRSETAFEVYEVSELELEHVGGSVADMLKKLCGGQNIDTLALCLSAGVFDEVLAFASNAQRLFDWLLQLALGDASGVKLDAIRPALMHLIQKHEAVASDFVADRCRALFAAMGANPEVLPTQDIGSISEPPTISLDRKLAADVICELISAMPLIAREETKKELAMAAASHVLLFHDLAVDHSTSKALQHSARQAARRLILIAAESDPAEAIPLLIDGSGRTPDHSAPRLLTMDDADVQIFTGHSPQHQGFVAWASCALLGGQIGEQATPFPMIPDVLPLAEDLFHALNVRRPDHHKIERMIELFAASLGGINDFIERCGQAYDVHTKGPEECDKEFKNFKDVVGFAMRRFPTHPAGTTARDNRSRLSQLHVNLGRLYRLATDRWDRQRVARMKGLRRAEAGAQQSGQLRLDFGQAK